VRNTGKEGAGGDRQQSNPLQTGSKAIPYRQAAKQSLTDRQQSNPLQTGSKAIPYRQGSGSAVNLVGETEDA